MNLKNYKFIVIQPFYGDVYDYCYADLKELENIDLKHSYINFKSKLEEKIYYKHFTKKYNLPFKKIWNNRYFKNKFSKQEDVIFLIPPYTNILKLGIIKDLKKKYKKSSYFMHITDLMIKDKELMNNLHILDDFNTVFSFDFNDCEKYNFNYFPLVYSAPKELENIQEDIDVYFCGRAKERLDLIMKTFKYLKSNNLNCLFILRDVPLDKRENIDGLIYLDKFMSYEENLKYVKRSKCLLEIMQEGGAGYTLRTCEAIAYNKKIITNNQFINDAEFYDKNMISVFDSVENIDIDFIKKEKGEYKDRHYFSPIKLLEKVVSILEEKEGK